MVRYVIGSYSKWFSVHNTTIYGNFFSLYHKQHFLFPYHQTSHNNKWIYYHYDMIGLQELGIVFNGICKNMFIKRISDNVLLFNFNSLVTHSIVVNLTIWFLFHYTNQSFQSAALYLTNTLLLLLQARLKHELAALCFSFSVFRS